MLAAMAALAGAAQAGETLQRVQRDRALRCSAAERPGFAGPDGGMAADLCRAMAIAVGGPGATAVLDVAAMSPESVRRGIHDLYFVSGDEVAAAGVAGLVVPGPTVFIERVSLLVPEMSAAARPEDLAGRVVCFMIAGPGHVAIEAALGRVSPPIVRLGFQEQDEMLDAFNAGRCQAMADESTRLALWRQVPAINRRYGRLLEPPLALVPLMAATARGDDDWSADVAWAMNAMVASARAPSRWRDDWAADSSGLRPGWRADMLQGVGTYSATYERAFGAIGLLPGPNAPWPSGLLLPIDR